MTGLPKVEWPLCRTSEQLFDFDGSCLHLTGAFCNPKPVQQPYPPILIGGRSAPTLRFPYIILSLPAPYGWPSWSGTGL